MNKIIFILIAQLTLVGCTKEDDIVEVVQPTNVLSEAEQINQWIYDEMNHYYLWRQDMPDSVSCDFKTTPKEFYVSLLSSKDRFSYFSSNQASRSTEDLSYLNLGFHYQEYINKDGKKILNVLFVISKEARTAGIRRGDLIINPSIQGNTIKLEKVSIQQNGSIKYLSKAQYALTNARSSKNETVFLDSIYRISNNSIGYMCYLEFDDPSDFRESINNFAENNITDLILDLRYNPGGLVNTCRKLCNLIVSSSAYGKLFQQCSFNDIISKENINNYGQEKTYTYFSEPKDGAVLGDKYEYLNLKRLFVLTSKNTASASEAAIISLKPYIDVIIIGEQTTGKGVGMYTLSDKKYKYVLVPITFRYFNANDETVPDDGLLPDYFIPNGYTTTKKDLGDINEPLLNKALQLICPNYFISSKVSRSYYNENIYLKPLDVPSYVQKFNKKNQ